MDYPNLQALIVCRDFLKDPVVSAIIALLGERESSVKQSHLAGALIEKAEQLGLQGNVFSTYLLYLLGEGKNTAAQAIETYGMNGSGLEKALTHDMGILWPYLKAKASDFIGDAFLDDYYPTQPATYEYMTKLQECVCTASNPQEGTNVLLQLYREYGSGKLARYIAFRIGKNEELVGIDNFPAYDFEDLIGYEVQKQKLDTNTKNFIAGRKANNVLLTGSRGTGKSTAVKALVNHYHLQGLRLIQIVRGQLEQLPVVMETLSKIQSNKFILFLDDLSFDEGEVEYKHLKSVIDGGVTPQPENVLIYATSNRRHLLKETWKDRSDEAEELYRHDSVNESISLSDRFGLILHYAEPTQDEYLQMIDHELQKAGVHLSKEDLRIKGVRWEMEHSGRNGRIAHQFVNWYLGNHKKN
jgi:predicted AAA+ superfamily ATPase